MKKKILLIIGMFLFITNVNALTFNVDLTDIEDKGSSTLGSITNINVTNKELDASFQGSGDEVNFELTITNSGDRVGTLKSIGITSTNNKIEYTTNLPGTGLAINGNGTNKVLVNAKVLDGATAGTSKTIIKITYNYDEGSCPEGEILSEDETMCLCPNGRVRKDDGTCDDPEDAPECEEDEVYNETKKICEKITPPVTPSNPKTLDNIVLITLLFIVSGLGIYALLFSKLRTRKQRVIAGITTSTITLSISLTALISAFGIDNLLGAIINPITKTQEIEVTVNETITPIETWDGTECSLTLTPEYIFDGGSGIEADPYQIKTAEQLVCFAKSINEGTTYSGQFIKQTSDIKLNDNLVANMDAGTTDGLHVWVSAGNPNGNTYFGGTYDGNNKRISGILISAGGGAEDGLFGSAIDATFKNMILSDVYVNVSHKFVGALVGKAQNTLVVDNVTTSGKYGQRATSSGGVIGIFSSDSSTGFIRITNTTNNISPVPTGIIYATSIQHESEEPSIVFKNVVNNGDFYQYGGISESITGGNQRPNVLLENVVNNGNRNYDINDGGGYGGLIGRASLSKLVMKNSSNTGNLISNHTPGYIGGLIGVLSSKNITIQDCFNSGNLSTAYQNSYYNGLTVDEISTLRSTNPAGTMGGLVGSASSNNPIIIKDSFNSGKLSGLSLIGGILGYNKNSDDHVDSNLSMDNCYNTGDILVGDGAVGGLVAVTKGTINNSYNTGDITIWGFRDPFVDLGTSHELHQGTMAGGLVGKGNTYTWKVDNTGAVITNSYNEGDILVTAKTDNVTVGGICGLCSSLTNTDNRGNITSKHASVYLEGLAFRVIETTNSNFEGEITTEELPY